jgi:hypothetical protein
VSRNLTIISIIALIFLALAILGGLVWVNTLYARSQPMQKEFLVPWLGARTFLQYGESPYNQPATQRAQIQYYNRLASAGEDPLRLDVAFPVELFYFPFALITDYPLALGLWMTVLEIALAALAFLSLRLTDWKPGRLLLAMFLLFSLLWVYGMIPLTNGSSVILVALAVAGFLYSFQTGREELAGALLFFPFFKADIAGLFILFVFWWMIYHRYWRVLAGFGMALVVMLAFSFLFLPGWFLPFLGGVLSHLTYAPGLTPGRILGAWWPVVGPRFAWVLIGALLIVIYLEWRDSRGKEYCHFLWTAGLMLCVAPLMGLPVVAGDYVVLFIPLTIFLSILAQRWSRKGPWNIAGTILLVSFAALWMLTIGLSFLGAYRALTDILMLALPISLVVGMYWMRWWAVRPPRTWLDTVRE